MGPPSSPYLLEVLTLQSPSLSHNRVLQTASLQIALEETNLPRHYISILSQLWSSFCSSLHYYRERIWLVPSPLCPSCGLMPHTTVHVFSCSSHPTSLTELDQWERPCLASEFLSSLPFFDLPHLLPLPLSPLLLTDKRVRGKHYHHWLQILVCLCTGCDSRFCVYCLFYKLFDWKFWFVLAQNATVSYVYILFIL